MRVHSASLVLVHLQRIYVVSDGGFEASYTLTHV